MHTCCVIGDKTVWLRYSACKCLPFCVTVWHWRQTWRVCPPLWGSSWRAGALQARHETAEMRTLQTERERGGEEREKSLLSTCISETLVKQDVCCTLDGTQLNLNKHLSNITLTWSGLPFQVAKFSLTRLYKPITLHIQTSSLLCTQSQCGSTNAVV